MRVLFSGSTACDFETLKRLTLIADEVGFMDRPSVTFRGWGTIGHKAEIRRYDTTGAPVVFSAHAPPSGPVTELYQRYIDADVSNPTFVATVLEGLSADDRFASKFIQLQADYGSGKGHEVRAAIVGDPTLARLSLAGPVEHPERMFQFATEEDRRQTFKTIVIEASIHVTNSLLISEGTNLLPVSDDPYMCRLIGLRTSGQPYLRDAPRVAPHLAIAVANAVIPAEALAQLRMGDVFSYRESTKDAYRAWSTEIDRLAAQIDGTDPLAVERELPRIINTDVKPRLIEYQNEMKAARDRLFGEVIKKVVQWEAPTLSLAYLAGLNIPGAIALFASALAPAIPDIVDYYTRRRDVRRRNSMAYLIGIAPTPPEDR